MRQTNYQGALQKPIGSGFNATSTATDVIKDNDLEGKSAIVTGGNTGSVWKRPKCWRDAHPTEIEHGHTHEGGHHHH